MKTLILILFFLLPFKSFSHPVIYQGGWALSSSNMADFSNNYLMYSFTNNLAVGLDHWRFTKDGVHQEMGLLKLNHLLWRGNGPDYQANVYLHGGIGIQDQNWSRNQSKEAYLLGAEADWETRTLYTAVKYYNLNTTRLTQARVGFSPVITDFNNLQTWFMIQAMHINEVNDVVMITPMLRFFYQNVLWEMGSSTRGDWMLNLMVHY